MRKSITWSAVAAVSLSLGLATAPAASAVPAAVAVQSAVPQNLSPEVQQVVDNLPAMRARAESVRAKLGLADSPVRDALIAAIDPTNYQCSDATPAVVAAILPDTSAWTFEQRLAVLHVLLFDIAMMDAVYFPQSGPYTFGARGEFTHTVTKTFKDLRSFWDIPSADVELVPGHGRSMLDSEVDYRVFTAMYGAAPGPSRVSADLVARELNSAALGYGDLPLFTFNAYAAPGGEDIPDYGTSHRRIAFGDGVLDGFAKIGLDDVAPQAILAHKFGRQIQYSDGLMRNDLPGTGGLAVGGADGGLVQRVLPHPRPRCVDELEARERLRRDVLPVGRLRLQRCRPPRYAEPADAVRTVGLGARGHGAAPRTHPAGAYVRRPVRRPVPAADRP
ncbi:MAG TPA: hypothetical protein VIH10_15995 [Kribbella sp.]